MTNEAAKRLTAVLRSFDYERHVTLLDDALRGERRATVERFDAAVARLTGTTGDPRPRYAVRLLRAAILDEEVHSTDPWLDVDRLAKALAATYQATYPLAAEGDWQSDAKFIAAEYGLAAPSSENEASR